MSIVDDFIAAVTPKETQADRADARARARAEAEPGDWLDLILQHHILLENAFAVAASASNADGARNALKRLGIVLTGHAIAEEAVVYPAMAQTGDTGHAGHGYDEQAIVKMEMANLEKLDPMSREYLDKLETIRKAVAHHMYEEEGTWFLDLKAKVPVGDQQLITQRYKQEFDRYVRTDGAAFAF